MQNKIVTLNINKNGDFVDQQWYYITQPSIITFQKFGQNAKRNHLEEDLK